MLTKSSGIARSSKIRVAKLLQQLAKLAATLEEKVRDAVERARVHNPVVLLNALAYNLFGSGQRHLLQLRAVYYEEFVWEVF